LDEKADEGDNLDSDDEQITLEEATTPNATSSTEKDSGSKRKTSWKSVSISSSDMFVI
jgi:hypothetical protein